MVESLNFAVDGAENFVTYRLENDSIIRSKLVLVRVVPSGRYADNGLMIYDCQWQHIMDVACPDHLTRQKPQEERR